MIGARAMVSSKNGRSTVQPGGRASVAKSVKKEFNLWVMKSDSYVITVYRIPYQLWGSTVPSRMPGA